MSLSANVKAAVQQWQRTCRPASHHPPSPRAPVLQQRGVQLQRFALQQPLGRSGVDVRCRVQRAAQLDERGADGGAAARLGRLKRGL
jgi:hypothetical protein